MRSNFTIIYTFLIWSTLHHCIITIVSTEKAEFTYESHNNNIKLSFSLPLLHNGCEYERNKIKICCNVKKIKIMKNEKLSLPFQSLWLKLFGTLLGGRLRLLECYILTSHDAYRFNNNMKLRGIYFFINNENVLLWTDMSSYEFLLIEKWFVKKDSWLWVMSVRKRETWRFHLQDFYFSEWENKMHNFFL